MKRRLVNCALVLVFIAGLCISLYPMVSNQFNLYRASLLISTYQRNIAGLAEEDYSAILEACEAYNQALTGGTIPDVFSEHAEDASPEYLALLNTKGDGLMGYIEIPAIGLRLPVYHTVFEDVLQEGVGHLEGSSLPIGGPSSHCVLAGHRGLPSARLFTDLDKLSEGDVFYLSILNEVLVYQVDQILVVEPRETEHLAIVEGEDYVTMVTCTPYGINTQRLLVRGTRVHPELSSQTVFLSSDAQKLDDWAVALSFGLPVLALGLLLYAIFRRRK